MTNLAKFAPVLIDRDDYQINSDVSELEEIYQSNAEALTALQEALIKFEDRSVGVVEMITFIKHDNPKSYLLGQFVENQDFKGIPIKSEKLEELLEIPPYEHILELRKSFVGWTDEDIMAYYDEGEKRFKPRKVSKKEKEIIVAKHSIYIDDPKDYSDYEAAKKFCEFMAHFHRSDRVNEITPVKLRNTLHFVLPYVKYSTVQGKFSHVYTWEVDPKYWSKKQKVF